MPLGWVPSSHKVVTKRQDLCSFYLELQDTQMTLFLPGLLCWTERLKGMWEINYNIHRRGRGGTKPGRSSGWPWLWVRMPSSWDIPGSCPFVKPTNSLGPGCASNLSPFAFWWPLLSLTDRCACFMNKKLFYLLKERNSMHYLEIKHHEFKKARGSKRRRWF